MYAPRIFANVAPCRRDIRPRRRQPELRLPGTADQPARMIRLVALRTSMGWLRRALTATGDTSPRYWIIGEALQKPPQCSLGLEGGRLAIAIFSRFNNVLSFPKICDAFAFLQHCKQKALSVREFFKFVKRLLVH